MALYPPDNPQPPSKSPPIDPRDRPKKPPPDWIPDWLKPFVPPPPPPIELDPPYDPPRPFWEPVSPDNRTKGGPPFAANHPALLLAFDQFLTPASYLQMVNWSSGFPTASPRSQLRRANLRFETPGNQCRAAEFSGCWRRRARAWTEASAASRVRQCGPRAAEFSARLQHPRSHDDADRAPERCSPG